MNTNTALYVDDNLQVVPILRALAEKGYTVLVIDGRLVITKMPSVSAGVSHVAQNH